MPNSFHRDAREGDAGHVPAPLGESEVFLEFQDRLSRVARVERPVLIMGERGTGKELAARQLHYLSKRWAQPLVALNCAALTPTLIESELFGHEPGAFTGAGARRRGRFEAADGGTFFLDELGNVPRPVQEKILRAVEYGSFERVGGSESIRVDVRIIGATNAHLDVLAERGEFMRDLLDRLSFEVLVLPPLRARREDILLLANHFAGRMAYELGRGQPAFSATAERALQEHPWRGNVRELKNVVERAVYRADGDTIEDLVFDPFDSPYYTREPLQSLAAVAAATPARCLQTYEAAVYELELRLLGEALEVAQYNQREAAKRLGMTYDQFRGVYRKHQYTLEVQRPEG
jgi:psp operon transcriptional activator